MRRTSCIILATLMLLACANPNPSASVTPTATITNLQTRKITQLSAIDIADKIAKKELTAVEVTTAFLTRIQSLDKKINSIVSLNPEALALAASLDAEFAAGKLRGVLHGVPILVKDNVEVAEMATTAGSLALQQNYTNRDAPIVKRLKDQGAIILGKTNLSEWANFRSNNSISGWSAIGGQTYNPHSLDRSPCGSSSGSGAAIAAFFAPLAIGTETNGSIMCPAAMNGIVGFKPTVGLLSRTHIVPISYTQDSAGPMTRSIADAALMMNVMAGSDIRDPMTLAADSKKQNYLTAITRPVDSMRVGVLRFAQGDRPAVSETFEKALTILSGLKVELVNIDNFETPEGFWGQALKVLEIEFKHYLNAYLATTPESVKTKNLADLIQFNNTTPRELVLFDQSLFKSSQVSATIESDEYKNALAILRKTTRDDGIDRFLREFKVDVLVMPSRPAAFLIDVVYGDSYPGGSVGAGWLGAIAGYPIATVPMGMERGLPLGLGFMSGAWQDDKVLQLAYAFEQASQKIVTPSFAVNASENQATKEAMNPF